MYPNQLNALSAIDRGLHDVLPKRGILTSDLLNTIHSQHPTRIEILVSSEAIGGFLSPQSFRGLQPLLPFTDGQVGIGQ